MLSKNQRIIVRLSEVDVKNLSKLKESTGLPGTVLVRYLLAQAANKPGQVVKV